TTVLPEPATSHQRLILPFLIDISLFCSLVNVSGLFLLLVSSLGETTLFRLLTSLCINFSGPRVNVDLSINNSFGNRSSSLFASDRKSTRLNSSHVSISYSVFCLKK